MKGKLKRIEVWFKLVLFLFFLFLYLTAIPYPEKSKQFPQLIAIVCLILLAVSLGLDLTKKELRTGQLPAVDDTTLEEFKEPARGTRRKRFLQAWAIVLFSTAAGIVVGFVFMTFSLLAGFAWFYGKRKDLFRNMAVAVVMTMITYLVFEWIMGVPLLQGLFW
jgi:hypothetical protein